MLTSAYRIFVRQTDILNILIRMIFLRTKSNQQEYYHTHTDIGFCNFGRSAQFLSLSLLNESPFFSWYFLEGYLDLYLFSSVLISLLRMDICLGISIIRIEYRP